MLNYWQKMRSRHIAFGLYCRLKIRASVNLRPRQPNPFLRAGAAACLIFWLVCVALCDAEHLFEFDHHKSSASHEHGPSRGILAHQQDAPTATTRQALAESDPAQNAGEHSHGSDRHDGNDSCCSTIKAPVPSAKPLVVSKPTLNPAATLVFRFDPSATPLRSQEKAPVGPSKNREWVFTPEVYLGPAFRSLAPPACI